MSLAPPGPGMKRYKVTYLQEVVQEVNAPTIEAAARFAKKAAADVKGASVLSIYLQQPELPPAPAA